MVSHYFEHHRGCHKFLLSRHVPHIRFQGKFPIWYDANLIQLCKCKRKAHTKFKKSRLPVDYDTFKLLRANFKTESIKRYKVYLEEVQEVTPNNVKKFWSFTKAHMKSNTYPSSFRNHTLTASKPNEICRLFSDFFRSNFKYPSPVHTSTQPDRRSVPCSNMLAAFHFEVDEVMNDLSKIDVNKNGGPDSNPNIFLRQTASTIALPLTFSQSSVKCHS